MSNAWSRLVGIFLIGIFYLSTIPSLSAKDKIILYQADMTRCGIIDDRALLGYTGDFAIDIGDDFSCSILPEGGLQIAPRNGFFFTKSLPPLFEPGPIIGGSLDHRKFFAFSVFAEAPLTGEELCTTWVCSGQQLNVNSHPFGNAVVNPQADPRLANFCLLGADPYSNLAFTWMCTNEIFYVFVDRSPRLEALFGNYASYGYLIPVFKRDLSLNPLEDVHTFQICYNRKKGIVTWKLDGRPVFSLTQFGVRLTEQNAFVYNRRGCKRPLKNPDSYKVFDHGGVEQLLDPIGIQTGIALVTLLDAYAPRMSISRQNLPTPNIGLTRLEANLYRVIPNLGFGGFYYNDPHLPLGIPAQFVTDAFSVLGPDAVFLPTIPSNYRLWGQGAILRLFDYTVTIEK